MKTTKRSSRSRGRHELAASRSPAWTQRIVAFIIVAFMLCQALPGLVQLAQAAAPASNITTKMRIVSGSSEAETDAIESGAPFRVEFTYSLRPNSADQSYKGLLISIQVPDGLDIYGLTGSTDVVDGGAEIVEFGGSRFVQFTLKDEVETGAEKTVSFMARFDNMTTANGTTASFQGRVDGHFIDGETATPIDDTQTSASIRAIAGDEWTLAKEALAENDPNAYSGAKEDGYHYITFKLTADTASSLGYDRNGRLELASFTLVDTLPTGYPLEGGAEFVELKGGPGVPTLTEQSNYTLAYHDDQSLKSVTITDAYRTAAEEGSNTPAGASMKSEYYLTVRYNKKAYESPSNETIKEYTLKNDAKLTYRLVTENTDRYAEGEDTVTLGWKESQTTPYTLTVEKKIAIGDYSAILDGTLQAVYGSASFGLYKDEACTIPAVDIDGSTLTPNPAALGTDGKVSFSNLRYGVYYLKETAAPAGFDGAPVTPVEIAKTGAVYLNGSDTPETSATVTLANTAGAGGPGIVAFTKVGKNAAGDTQPLAGVSFELRREDGSVVAAAQSGGDGSVVFHNVPAGTCKLYETALPGGLSGEFATPSAPWTVTVEAGKVCVPQGAAEGTVLNTSAKGRLKLIKTGKDNAAVAGAKFEIYGPSATEPSDETLLIGEVTIPASGYVSDPLEPGTYWVRETAAPDGYTLDSAWHSVTVSAAATQTITLTNALNAKLSIHKWGMWGGTRWEGLGSVSFDIYNAATGGDKVATITTTVDATGKPDTPFIELPAGNYWAEEVMPPVGYAPLTGRIAIGELKAGEARTLEVENNATYGRLTIIKTDGHTGAPMAGVVFEVYTTADCSGDPIATLEATDAEGKAESGLLPTSQPLYLKEKNTPAGYVPRVAVIKGVDGEGNALGEGGGIRLTASTMLTVQAKNDPMVSIGIVKTDSFLNTPIPGVSYALYEEDPSANPDAEAVQTGKTDNEGRLTFSGLTPGKSYWYRETAVSNAAGYGDYLLDGAVYAVTAPFPKAPADPDTVVEARTNTRMGKIRVVKSGLMDGEAITLAGAKFALYPKTGDDAETDKAAAIEDGTYQADAIVTGADGVGLSAALAPGAYWLEETEAPEGYEATAPAYQAVEVRDGMNYSAAYRAQDTAVTNTAAKGKVQIKKVDSTDSSKGLAVTYHIYQKLGDGAYAREPVGAVTTAAGTGLGLSGWLAPGEYGLKEAAAPEGYVLDEAYHDVTVVAGETNKVYVTAPLMNVPQRRIHIEKYALWKLNDQNSERIALDGATFSIYKKVSNNQQADCADEANRVAEGLVTGAAGFATGLVSSPLLPPGEYWVVETAPAEDYELPDPSYQAVTLTAEQDETVAFDNESVKGRIRLHKKLLGTGAPLDGAQFELYVVDEAGTPTDVNGTTVNLSKVDHSTLESGTDKKAEETGHTGRALTGLLEPGKRYYLKETRLPLLPAAQYEMLSQWTGPIQVEAGTMTETEIYNYIPASPPGQKVNEAGDPVEGAWIAIFEQEADAQAMNTWLETQSVTEAQLTDANFLADHSILQVQRSGANGVFSFTGLVPLRTYYALEVLAPANFVRDESIHNATVSENGNSFDGDLIIVNIRYGRIKVQKVTVLSGKTYGLDGAKFAIYPAKAKDGQADNDQGGHDCGEDCRFEKAGDTPVYTGVTGTIEGEAGTLLSGLLPPGHYIVEETEAPAGFIKSSRQVHVTVKSNDVDMTCVDTPFENRAEVGRLLVKKTDAANPATRLAATYKVQVKGQDGQFADYTPAGASQVMTLTTSTQGDTLTGYMPAGQYQLIETKAPVGYTLDPTPIPFTIEGGKITGAGGQPQDTAGEPLALTDAPQGSLLLEKKSQFASDPEAPMQGVVFTLYKKETNDAEADCVAANQAAQGTTGVDGKLLLTGLDAGVYWLKETSVGGNTGYAANLAAISVTVKAGEQTQLTEANCILNQAVYGKLRMQKKDRYDDTPLDGAVFDVYTDAGCQGEPVDRLTTDGQGYAVSGLLAPGSYYLKEITPPSGYLLDETIHGPYTVTANAYSVQIELDNEKAQTVTLYKYYLNGTEKAPIPYVQFALYDVDPAANPEAQPIRQQQTGTDGLIRFGGLKPNTTYYLKELAAPAGYVDRTKEVFSVTTNNKGSQRIEIENIPQGQIKLLKQAQWTEAEGEEAAPLPVEGAVLTLYRLEGNSLDTATRGQEVGSITTDATGVGQSQMLDPGYYELVETTVPEGYTAPAPNSFKLQVVSGQVNDQYFTAPINNVPSKGRFQVIKRAASDGEPYTLLDGAVFELYRKVDGEYVKVSGMNPTFTVEDGEYLSGVMDLGDYMIREIQAPSGYTLDETPHYFTLDTAAAIVKVDVENNAKGSITLTKKADAQNGSLVLEGAAFQLYENSVAEGNEVGSPKQTGKNGQCAWTGLDAGHYIIVETVPPEGYALNPGRITVDVAQSGTAVNYPVEMVDDADAGRIVIAKQDAAGNPLKGAEFEIWPVDGQGNPTGSKPLYSGVATEASGLALSGLVPAAKDGTEYLVRETKAPDGYTLDDRLSMLEKRVTVYPVHVPTGEVNKVTFTNAHASEVKDFPSAISKSLSAPDTVRSLMLEPLELTFQLAGYATGANTVPMENFTVTDSDIRLYSYVGTGSEEALHPLAAGDYRITAVQVMRALNADGGEVAARIEYQGFSELGTDSWKKLDDRYQMRNLQNLAAGSWQEVDLTQAVPDEEIMAVRVVYDGIKAGFTADGMRLTARFAQREGGEAVNEIRVIRNTGTLSYQYEQYDETGAPTEVPVSIRSNEVEQQLPSLAAEQVPVSITNKTQGGSTVYSGQGVPYRMTAKNESVSGQSFFGPILAVDLPAYTILDETYHNNARFKITDSQGFEVEPLAVSYQEKVPAMQLGSDGVSLTPILDGEGNPVYTQRIVFVFPDDYEMKPGETLSVDYQVYVDLRKPSTVTQLYCPAYLSSSVRYPVTVQNPLGLSFVNDKGSLSENESLDGKVDSMLDPIPGEEALGENRYAMAGDTVAVVDDSAVSIVKSVKGSLDEEYLGPAQIAYTYPNGDLSYRLTLYNNGSRAGDVVRIVDILPVAGDTYVVPSDTGVRIERDTEVPRRPILEDIVVPAGATVYYSTKDWTSRSGSGEDELPMLYSAEGSWAGWTTDKPADEDITAIGFEFHYDDPDARFAKGESVTVELKMRTPGFTTEEIEAFYDKITANSAAGAVMDSAAADHWSALVENNQVKSYMRLPTGSIGDYVFIDRNNNGIQDEGDTYVEGLKVTLYETRTRADGQTQYETHETTTDADGRYQFEGLNCSFLKEGAPEDSTDPNDYIGGVIYSYRVVFEQPGAEYAPTLRYAGEDPAKDSNIGADFSTEEVMLHISEVDGQLVGEDNDTLDAGFIIPASLGDRVWLDMDRDGLQVDGEPGVNGVKVNLYRLTDGQVDDTPYATTETATMDGQDGMYRFDHLVPGQYVVEFDIRDLKKEAGGAYQYAFTPAKQGTEPASDSDAEQTMEADDRVRRTGVITLNAGDADMTWDAGLMVYSALGGYAYDDRNYNDVQDLGVALPGTVVTLYRVVNGVREDAPLRPPVTVGEDGLYYFDGLIEGDYQVHFDYPDGYKAVTANVGGDDTLDSDVELELTDDLNSGYTAVIHLGYNSIDTTWDGGARLTGAIGDYVWFDENKNGLQDDGEQPAADIMVVLQRREGSDGLWKFVGVDSTDEKGRYLFDNLPCGPDSGYEYRVLFNVEAPYALTIPKAGGDTALDSDALGLEVEGLGYPTGVITLDYGQRDMTWDAGLIRVNGSVGDYVWLDENRNGRQDEDEMGIAGVLVVLEYNESGMVDDAGQWRQVAETTTNESGYYRFDNLDEGYYRVRFLLPEGLTVTALNALEAEDGYTMDSDAQTPDDFGWSATRGFYLEQEGYDMTWDAGLYAPQPGEPDGPDGGTGMPGTGDSSRVLQWLILMSGCLMMAFVVMLWRRRNIQ